MFMASPTGFWKLPSVVKDESGVRPALEEKRIIDFARGDWWPAAAIAK
jgi:hypothetical protein